MTTLANRPQRRETTEPAGAKGLGRGTQVGIGAAALVTGGTAVYTLGAGYAGAAVPDELVWTAAAGLLAVTGAGLAAARIARWVDDRRHLAVEIPEEELDPAAVALLNRVREQRRQRGEVV
jgi:hypothetical protein